MMPMKTILQRRRIPALVIAGIATAAAMGGCYETTTRVDGVGAIGRDAQGSQRSNTAADRWWDSTFGNPTDSGKRATDFPAQKSR